MRKIDSVLFAVILVLTFSSSSFAQKSFFADVNESSARSSAGARVIVPQKYRTVSLANENLKSFLRALPSEKNVVNRKATPVLELPMPDGRTASFNVWESSIQEPALEAKFPEIRTFVGQGISDPYATIRFDYTPRGFHAQVLTVNGTYYIDPFGMSTVNNYISYFRTDLLRTESWECGVVDVAAKTTNTNFTSAICLGNNLRTYRLAVANTGEYAQAPGVNAGSDPALLHAAIVTSVNRVVGVYEKEVALRMILVANNNLVEFLDPATDPFTANNNGNALLNESQSVINANIGFPNYDIGHTFSTGAGGVAQLNSPCGTGKARGVTGSPSPTGDAFDIDYVAHEMGHQWGGNHTMAHCGSVPAGTKFEPGSGTTIQAYAGICGGQDIQPNSDPYFHAISFDEISNFITTGNGNSCGISTPTGNNIPIINPLVGGMTIPVSTPFTLTGSATDPDGDALTYNWEGWDLGGSSTSWNSGATAPVNNTFPLFKSRIPKTTGSRTFPDIAVILANYPTNPPATMNGLKGETLSPVARPMKFRLTVRDNRASGGGVASAGEGCQSAGIFQINVAGTAPFTVAIPNGGESYPGGSSQTITWNVVGTNAAPFNVANVKISLSTDGGLTYPTLISLSTPNDGSELLTIPSVVTTTARVKVEALSNIFFDISNANFTISVPLNGFTFNATTTSTSPCPATSPTVTIGTTVTGTFTTPIVLSSTGAPAGTTVTFAPNPLTPGSSTVATFNNANTLSPGTYNITVTGTAGTTVQTTTITFIISAGAAPVITTQPLSQSVCAPATATFTVASSTAGVTYQWQVSTAAVPAFTNIAAATSASYTTPATTSTMSGNVYRVIVSTQCGSTTSSSATLTVNSAASITTQPTNQFACTGNTATFTVGAAGTGVTYQWQSSATAGGPFTNVTTGTGGTTASYTTAPITGTTDGFYRVIVTTTTCAGSVTSSEVTLTITTTTTITSQPVSQTVCAPATATFSVTATGSGLSYQWQVSTAAVPAFTNITGATSASYTTPPTTASMSGNVYRVIVTNSCNTVTSSAATLTVNTTATITAQPVSQSACTGNTATFTVGATGTGVTYQWQSAPAAGGPFTNVTSGTGGTTATYTTAPVTVTTPGFYRVIVTTTTCAGSITSNVVTLTITQTTAITTQPASQTVCAPGAATFSVSAIGANLTYQWQISTAAVPAYTNIGGANGSAYNTGATTVAMSGNSYQVVVTGTCNTVTSNAVTLTVNTTAAMTTQPTDQTVCNGTTATFTAAATGTGVTYQWQQSASLTGPFANVTTGTGGTTASYTTPVTTPAMNNTYYRVIAATTSCAGSVTSNVVKLTVNTVATIVTQPTAQSACVPNPVTFSVNAIGTGLTYQWQISTNGGAAFTDIAGATGASYTIPATAFSMNGSLYRVNILSTCSPTTPTTSNAVLLTVNNPVAVTQNPQPQRGCAGDNYTFSVAATGGTLSYQWQVSTNGGTTYTNATPAIPADPTTSGTASSYTINNAPISLNGNLYRVIVTGTPCGQVTTPGALLTLGNKPTVVLTAASASSLNPSVISGLYTTVSPIRNYRYELRKNGVLVFNNFATSFFPLTIDDFGSYQVTITDTATGCSSLSNVVKIDSLVSDKLFIYPNPVSTMMQVRYYSASTAPRGAMLNVFDSKGARVYSKAYNISGTYGRMDVDMSRMLQGIYMVELMDASGKKVATGRVMKTQ